MNNNTNRTRWTRTPVAVHYCLFISAPCTGILVPLWARNRFFVLVYRCNERSARLKRNLSSVNCFPCFLARTAAVYCCAVVYFYRTGSPEAWSAKPFALLIFDWLHCSAICSVFSLSQRMRVQNTELLWQKGIGLGNCFLGPATWQH